MPASPDTRVATPTSVTTRVGVFAAGAALSALLTYAAAYVPSNGFFTPIPFMTPNGTLKECVQGVYTFDSLSTTVSRKVRDTGSEAWYTSTTTLTLPSGKITSSVWVTSSTEATLITNMLHKLLTQDPDDIAILADLLAGVCDKSSGISAADRLAMFDALGETDYYKDYLAYQIKAADARCNPLETALFFLSAKVYPYQQVDADLRLPNAPASIINKAYQSSATPRAALTLATLLAASAVAAALV
jgi:hypothetical protein